MNTRVHLKICTRGWLMMREWAYRCHLEKLETSLGSESYARLRNIVWIGGPSDMGLRCHLERMMLRVSRTLGSVDVSGSERSMEMGLRCHPEGVVC